jgi:hypothetical protein
MKNKVITVTRTAPVKAVPVLTPQQKLKQFATKPVVKPLSTKVVKNITKPLNSYL